MASNPPIIEDSSHNFNTDEETIAIRKKRLRRVSFADREITSVHIFNRDDEYETPPDPSSTKNDISDRDDELQRFFGDLADSDDSKEISSPTGAVGNDNDDSINSRKSFFRPLESPSPGSNSIVGSATSNDEDNFFGPVSASFIRPGRLSDSGASDCNLDVTMDSTAFSMHYRSLVKSVSGEDLKTPTEVLVAVEEKTPSNITTPSDPGSLMVLTKDRKVILRNPCGIVEGSGGRDSNDMSLVEENMRSYDYGKLSPDLEALLSEAMKEPQAASAFLSDSTNVKLLERSEVSIFDENGSSHMDRKDGEDKEIGKVDMLDISAKGVSVASMELDEGNGISVSTLADQCSSPLRTEGVAVNAFAHHRVQSPIQLSKVQTTDQPGVVQTADQVSKAQTANQMSKLQTHNQIMPVNNNNSKVAIAMDVDLPAASIGITSNMDAQVLTLDSLKIHESGQHSADILKKNYFEDRRNNYDPDHNSDKQHGSISSLSAKKRQQIFLDASKSCRPLSYVTPSPKQPDSCLGKANLKSGWVQPSPLVSSLKDRIEKSKLRSSNFISSATSFNSVDRDHERLRLSNIDGYRTVPPSDVDDLTNTASLSEDEESLMHMSAHILSKEREVRPHILAEKSVDRASLIPGSGSSSVEIKVGSGNLMKTTNAPANFVSPSLKVLNQGLSSPIKHQQSLSGDMKQQLTFDELVSICFNQDKNSAGNVSSGSHSTAVTDELLSRFAERRPQSGSLLLDINYSEDGSQVKWVDDSQSYLQNKHGASKSSVNFQTPFRERNASNIHSGSPDRNILIVAPDPSHSEEELPGEKNKSPLQALASLYIPNNNFQSSSVRKRRIEEPVVEDAEHAEEIRRIKRSPYNRNPDLDMEPVLECSNGSINDREMVIGDLPLKRWTDISLKFSADTKQLLSPSIEKLNIKVIGMLQDILVCQQKVKKFEMLCSQIQPQKRTQQLSSAIQESKILKSSSIWHPSMSGEVDDNLRNSCTVKYGRKIEDSNEKLVTMRLESEALDRNIKSLTKSFHSYCKMKGEPSCAETIALVNDHLRRRTSCRFIRKDLQLWEVEDLSSRNGQLSIVLNYQGFICQRFTINAVPIRSISIANQLNYRTITKIFPNMDACVAFSYALNSETTKKYVGSKILAQETQYGQTNEAKSIPLLGAGTFNLGVYPSAVVPYQLQASANGTHKLLPESVSAQVKADVDNLTIGFSRIGILVSFADFAITTVTTIARRDVLFSLNIVFFGLASLTVRVHSRVVSLSDICSDGTGKDYEMRYESLGFRLQCRSFLKMAPTWKYIYHLKEENFWNLRLMAAQEIVSAHAYRPMWKLESLLHLQK
ncbi:unnamed protein product [Dovyalis caffra]|uniref:Knl1 C-terminal RWD domain-containing protein n=1 Tax=Dovyalis caffra TaxID=77055 RepID=A0AAV1R537_9ROSI|nr:unnamed protein product [Dovyalis caffra]